MSERDLGAVHRRLATELARAGAHLDGIYACPHEEGMCDCRKPRTGLFARARTDDPEISFRRSVVIGDSRRDMEAAAALGCCGVLIGEPPADFAGASAPSLERAVELVLDG
jgi:HAD superfamily hydrolase (TIGR01662 family)